MENEEQQASFGLKVISFLIPIVGLVIYLINTEKNPIKANAVGKAALWGVAAAVLLKILISL